MPWLELSVTVDAAQQATVEDALEELGALAITLLDADAETPDERAIFEPGAGQVPLWPRTTLTTLFDPDTNREPLVQALAEDANLRPTDLRFRTVEDQDWERVWMDRFRPMRFGRRLWVYPWNVEPPETDELAIVRLDPGLAFGTGTHATTALCLEWLDALALAGCRVIDYGCGSGVLALAALKLGATRVVGIDNDPQALTASRDNAERNGIGQRLDLFLSESVPTAPADVLVANILAGPLVELAPHLARCCRPGASVALSGILDGQQDAVLEAFMADFERPKLQSRDGWIRIDLQRKRARDEF